MSRLNFFNNNRRYCNNDSCKKIIRQISVVIKRKIVLVMYSVHPARQVQ